MAFTQLAAPAAAQEDPAAELDVLSQQSGTSADGLALARSQSENGDLLGALATIDRVLMIEPAGKPALLLRAQLLCRIDDRQGGKLQLSSLKKRDFARADWQRANNACAKPATVKVNATAPTPTDTDAANSSQRNRRWPPPGF